MLADWAAAYLNDRIAGLELGSNALRRRLDDPGLGRRERAFLATVSTLFEEALAAEQQGLYVGGTAGLLEDLRSEELDAYQRLLEVLEKRAALLEVVSQSLDPRKPFVRVGPELEHPAMRDLALVGASYGLTTRTLGAVTLLGPVRMDYDKALRSVRGSRARALAVRRGDLRGQLAPSGEYAGIDGGDEARLLRGPRRRARRRRERDQESVPRARPHAPPGCLGGAGRRGAFPRGRRGLRGPLEAGDARALRPFRARRPPQRRLQPVRLRPRQPLRSLLGLLRRRPLRRRGPHSGVPAARTRSPRSRSTSSRPRTGRSARSPFRSASPARRAAARAPSRAPSPRLVRPVGVPAGSSTCRERSSASSSARRRVRSAVAPDV